MVFVWSLVPSIWLTEFIARQESWRDRNRTTIFEESGNMLGHTWSQDHKSHLPRRKCGHHRICAYFPHSLLKSRTTWQSNKVAACKMGTSSQIKIIHANHPEFLEDRRISKDLWPPRSSDLPPPVLFLWGYLKERVFRNKWHTINPPKENITDEIRQTDNMTLRHATDNIQRCVQICPVTGHWSLPLHYVMSLCSWVLKILITFFHTFLVYSLIFWFPIYELPCTSAAAAWRNWGDTENLSLCRNSKVITDVAWEILFARTLFTS